MRIDKRTDKEPNREAISIMEPEIAKFLIIPIPTNALLQKWSKIPINLVESLPRRVEAVIAAKGGLTSYRTLWIKSGMSLKFICV